MGKRHEKGAIIIAFIILLSFFVMYLLKDSSPDMAAKENKVISNISVVTNDIAITDMVEENELEAEQNDLWILFDHLIFARNESTILTALFPTLLIVYIIVIGPIIYFVLKQRDKMEWMWILIPAISVMFAGIITLFGKSFAVESPVIDSLTVVSPGKDDVVYFTSTSPADKEFDLVYDEQVKKVIPLYEEKLSFSKDYVRLDVDQKRNGSIKCKLSKENGLPVGTIQNKTEWEFKHVMVCYEDYYCILPSLASGGTLNVNKGAWEMLKNGYTVPQMDENMLKKDCDRILKIAYLKYFQPSQNSQIQISAVIEDFEPVIINNEENLISYGLYQQWEQVK